VYSGAASPTDDYYAASLQSGAAAVRACDDASLQAATLLGFEIAYTTCTSDVTHYIAEHELSFTKRIQWSAAMSPELDGSVHLPEDYNITLYDKFLQRGQEGGGESRPLAVAYNAAQLSLPENAFVRAEMQRCLEHSFSQSHMAITIRREMRHLVRVRVVH
jgi:hypothetical protein